MAAAHLSEVTRVELVEEDTVVVLATGVTATAGMLPVLPDTPVAGGHVPPLLAVLGETRRLQMEMETHENPHVPVDRARTKTTQTSPNGSGRKISIP